MIKIYSILISMIFIFLGWSTLNLTLAIIGTILFVLILLMRVYKAYSLSKEFKNKEFDYEKVIFQDNMTINKIGNFLEGTIIIVSLVCTIFFQDKGDLFLYPTLIIWIGIIAIHFFSGIVIKEVANIPLRWSYGGWKINYRKRKK